MQKAVFTNILDVTTSMTGIQALLADPRRLHEWVPDIQSVTAVAAQFQVTRGAGALNKHEVITVTNSGTMITYHSRQGWLEYDLVFTLRQVTAGVQIQEDLYLLDENNLPLSLLAPIAKYAFNVNLERLAQIVA
ncbi:hypothetical protein ATO00_11875 [Loigolactobacillus coryniformis subsp. coryniformis]|uniref:SRPBCC family protein n=1 Tax=Loigolactobacillus coryniformis subsp. coryniformis KCTC 3167 = DSM 20001 TaxID=913848 RepID=A0A0R1EYJ2_9LACO|nr:hypothetical protein [Loigolactobacillus coryniformis]ATO55798.1 hypothetical protein LC20001_09120 [Loigolactobacillus coryniformis subsp. coryniformis KCTC 3167 = DSM 20001]KRK14668.1 hypothetical protein FD22_GL002235 [Loigolactobacillus coryniformis subsp. coryniformis KCTC 3167 = DSM 20001]OEH89338.1 hypothetical protein ATO00_11875 [Loigolactobacillus coryniformis subsp. coryniformis]